MPGRIVEKKTALWVYTMIRDLERRDPGLLFYSAPGELELRVFPVNAGTPAVVEIDFLAPVEIAPGTRFEVHGPIAVLEHLRTMMSPLLTRHASEEILIPGAFSGVQPPPVERPPYIHFLVDRSAGGAFDGDFPAVLRAVRERFPSAAGARVSLVNHDVVDLTPALTPLAALPALMGMASVERQAPAAGGFALDLALAQAVRRHRTPTSTRRRAGIRVVLVIQPD